MVRAMLLERPAPVESRPLRLVDLPKPEIAADEVLIRVTACGVCHTDLHIVEGEIALPRLPLVPGHQIVGTVERTGCQVVGLGNGDRAGIAWLHAACGKCEYCKQGLENLCLDAQFTGYHVHGGYAEYVAVKHSFSYRLPDGFDDRAAAPLLCAGIIGYRALRLCAYETKGNVGLYGFGASAHIALQVARHQGCDVYVFSRTRDHQRLALELGAVWAGGVEEDPPRRMDGSIIFAPAGSLVPVALGHLNKGGILALAGIYMTPIPSIDYNKLLYGERKITSVTASTRADARSFLKLAAKIPIRTKIEVFALEDANLALKLLKERKIAGAAVLKVAPAPAQEDRLKPSRPPA